MPHTEHHHIASSGTAAAAAAAGAQSHTPSVDGFATHYHTPNTEDLRSAASVHDEFLQTSLTAPLLPPHFIPASRVPSPQPPGALSPCTNASVCVPPHGSQTRYHNVNYSASYHYDPEAPRAGSHAGDGSVSNFNTSYADLHTVRSAHGARHTENVSFASVVAGAGGFGVRPHPDVLPDTPQTHAAPTIEAEPPSRGMLHRLLSVLLPSVRAFRDRVRGMTWKRILWVVLLVALVMVGNFMQIVMLNFWLISFPSDGTPGNYTAFAVPGIFFAILFVLLFGAYAVIRRPSLRFATHLHGWGILIGVGFCDAFNSWMATYAASYTSEVLQALFTNLCPLYAVFLSKWILSDTRRYANVYIASVFVLTICGILAASLYGIIMDQNVSEGKWWILIFFLSMPVRVLMNVWQSLYMIVYTRDPKFVSWLRVRFAEEAAATNAAGSDVEGSAGLVGDEPLASTPHDSSGTGTPRDTLHKPTKGRHAAAAAAAPLCEEAEDEEEEVEDAATKKKQKTKTRMVVSSPSARTQQQLSSDDGRGECAGEVSATAAEKAVKTSSAVSSLDDAAGAPVAASDVHLHERRAARSDGNNNNAAAAAGVSNSSDSNRNSVGTSTPAVHRSDAPADTFGVRAVEEDMNRDDDDDDEEEEEDVLSPTAAAAPPLPMQTMFTVRYNQGEDTVVKLVMLAGETFIQMCFTLSLLPADALPWWGNSDTVAATWANFQEGINCVFTIRENFLYCFLYTLGFVFTYVGCAYLNHYSAALCSIVSQLSSPVTALMLVIVPSWNVQESGDSPWYCNVVAIVFLCIAALLYVMWEEMTDHEKVQAEYALKMNQLHVRPTSHEAPHRVVMDG